MEGMKSFSETYLPTEQILINELFLKIRSQIKEMKKISYIESEKNPKEEFLEFFYMTDSTITFNKRDGNTNRWTITSSQLKDAIKYALRTDGVLTRQGFNKTFGAAKFVGTPLYLFVNLVIDEINQHRIVGQEVSHNSFGKGTISNLEPKEDFLWFKNDENLKKISMDYFWLNKEDEQIIQNKLAGNALAV
jgi:hypothetical protein